MLVPASMFLVPVRAQEQPELVVSTGLNGLQEIPLKAIQDSDGEIDTQNDFEIEPQNIVTLAKGADFHVLPAEGSVFAVKITDEQRQTTDVVFSPSDGRVSQDLASKAYLLDIIVEMDNGDKYLYETVLAILEPGQTLSEVNTQNIIQNFVSTQSDSHTTVVFKDEDDDNDDNEEELSVCYFHPNDDPHCVPVDGECPEDAPNMNEQGNCHPSGCPDGYSMLDDDETGTCYSDRNVIVCPGSNAKVLDRDDCAIYEPDEAVQPETLASGDNDTSSEAEEEPPVNENGEPLTSNCGGPIMYCQRKRGLLDFGGSGVIARRSINQDESSDEEDTQQEQDEEPEEQEESNAEEVDQD